LAIGLQGDIKLKKEGSIKHMEGISTGGWDWINPPEDWDGQLGNIEFTTLPNTDFWVKTHYGFTRHSGHFFHTIVEGDFEVSCTFSGNYRDQYDQAGLMLMQDEINWIKAGIEFVDGIQRVSAVITHGFSDWSTLTPMQPPEYLKIKLLRKGDFVQASYALEEGAFEMYRLGYFSPNGPVKVGVMAASPEGKGFHVHFRDFQILSG
jgi:uncharacterized protein